ncbi:hypothetical protein [Orenia metallireducens]|nr:hypothetical protein [Orenia metallireducens]
MINNYVRSVGRYKQEGIEIGIEIGEKRGEEKGIEKIVKMVSV